MENLQLILGQSAYEAGRSVGAIIALLVFGAIFLVVYFVPTIIGVSRKSSNLGTIIALNLLLGWTFVGWVVAMVLALVSVPGGMAPPPYGVYNGFPPNYPAPPQPGQYPPYGSGPYPYNQPPNPGMYNQYPPNQPYYGTSVQPDSPPNSPDKPQNPWG